VPKDLMTPEFASALLDVKGMASSVAVAAEFNLDSPASTATELDTTPDEISKAKQALVQKAGQAAIQAAAEAKKNTAAKAKSVSATSYVTGPVYKSLVADTVAELAKHEEAKKAISSYSNGGYGVNDKLRKGQPLSSTEAQRCANMDKAFKVAAKPFGQATTLYRKMSAPMSFLGPSPTVGTILIDNGYVSTSAKHDIWSGSVCATIRCKADQKGLFMQGVSVHSNENEVLLPRGSMFKLSGLNKSEGVYEVDLEYIG
jgi:hypothetical protein